MPVNIDPREYKGAAVETTIVGAINEGSTTITLGIATNWPTGTPGPFVVVLDKGLSTEEKVLILSRVGDLLNVAPSGRGYDNTSAATHAHGAAIEHCLDAASLQALNNAVVDLTTNGARSDIDQTVAGVYTFENGFFSEGSVELRGAHIGVVEGDGNYVTIADSTGTTTVFIGAGGTDTNIDFEHRTKGSGVHKFVLGSTEKARIATDGAFSAVGASSKFGVGALGAAGVYLQIGDGGDPGSTIIESLGTLTNIGMLLRTKGSGSFDSRTDGGWTVTSRDGATVKLSADGSAGATDTSISVRHNGSLKRVRAGASGTGPAGVGRMLYVDA